MAISMLAALLVAAAPAQEAGGMPLLMGAEAAPDCGQVRMAAPAVCVRTTIANLQPVFDAYVTLFEQQGWGPGAAIENGLVLTRAREGGGCEAMQVVAFNNPADGMTAASPGYLAIAALPDVACGARTGQ